MDSSETEVQEKKRISYDSIFPLPLHSIQSSEKSVMWHKFSIKNFPMILSYTATAQE